MLIDDNRVACRKEGKLAVLFGVIWLVSNVYCNCCFQRFSRIFFWVWYTISIICSDSLFYVPFVCSSECGGFNMSWVYCSLREKWCKSWIFVRISSLLLNCFRMMERNGLHVRNYRSLYLTPYYDAFNENATLLSATAINHTIETATEDKRECLWWQQERGKCLWLFKLFIAWKAGSLNEFYS